MSFYSVLHLVLENKKERKKEIDDSVPSCGQVLLAPTKYLGSFIVCGSATSFPTYKKLLLIYLSMSFYSVLHLVLENKKERKKEIVKMKDYDESTEMTQCLRAGRCFWPPRST
jgi:hypothetical protein